MSRSVHVYSQSYIEQCFQAWYLGGRPNDYRDIRKLLKPDDGRIPGHQVVNKWRTIGAWDERADVLDAQAIQQSDVALVNKKVQLLMKQQTDAMRLASKALEYLLQEGFDSSSAAVQAYFRSTEEQRKLEGFSDLLERLDKLKNDELLGEVMDMIRRASENDQVIEVNAGEVPELVDGENTETSI